MKSKVELAALFVALNLGSVLSQAGRVGQNNRPLPQWLTGIIAVVGFLGLTFVVFIVKRVWCEKPKRSIVDTEENDYESVMRKGSEVKHRDSEELKAYTNFAMEQSEDRVTAM